MTNQPTPTSNKRSAVREALEQMRGVTTTASDVAATNIPNTSRTPETSAVQPTIFNIRERTEMLAQHARDNGDTQRFLGQRSLGWYSKMLEGVPFVVVSEPIYRTDKAPWGEQEVAQAHVRLYDWEHGRETDSQLVTFQGRYLLNQLRAMTMNELVGSYVFTIARNPAMPLTPQGVYPLMLAVYDVTRDSLPPDTF